MDFIPEKLQSPLTEVPYFEDAKTHNVPGRATEKPIKRLQAEIIDLLNELGGMRVVFIAGEFPTTPKRYGYRIEFFAYGNRGRIDVAALPMRSEAPVKKERE